MKREMLKEMGLSDDQIDKIMKVNGEDIEGVKANVTAKETEIELLKNQLTEANKTIDGFKKLDVEGIKKEVEDWKGKSQTLENELEQVKNNAILDKALSESGAYDTEILKATLNHEGLKFVDGKVEGLEEQLKALKEEKAFLFKAEDKGEGDERFKTFNLPGNASNGDEGMASELDAIFNNL